MWEKSDNERMLKKSNELKKLSDSEIKTKQIITNYKNTALEFLIKSFLFAPLSALVLKTVNNKENIFTTFFCKNIQIIVFLLFIIVTILVFQFLYKRRKYEMQILINEEIEKRRKSQQGFNPYN